MKHVWKVVSGAVGFLVIALQACSTQEPAAPSRPPIPAPTDEAGIGNASDGGGGEGGAQNNCFDASASKPTTPADFLNQCNSAECFKFDNGARIEGFKGGPLPPLN